MKLTLKAFKEGAIPFSFFAFKPPDEFASRCIMDAASPVDKYIEWIRSTDTKVEDKGEYFVLLLDWIRTIKHLGYEPKVCEIGV